MNSEAHTEAHTALLDMPLNGRPPASVVFGDIRPLTPEDLAAADSGAPAQSIAGLQKVREVHHQAARLLATGMKAVEVSAIVGLSQSRLSLLQADPTFAELLAHYRNEEARSFADVQQRAVALGLDAMAELHERIVENAKEVPNSTLIEIMKSALDRGGHAPVKRSISVGATVPQEMLRDLQMEAAKLQTGEIVERAARNPQSGRIIEGELEHEESGAAGDGGNSGESDRQDDGVEAAAKAEAEGDDPGSKGRARV
jgi:hypothetical protein